MTEGCLFVVVLWLFIPSWLFSCMPLCFSHACCHASVIHAAVNLAAPQVAGGEATADSISSQPARDPFADEEPEFRALANKFLGAGMAHAACTACAYNSY